VSNLSLLYNHGNAGRKGRLEPQRPQLNIVTGDKCGVAAVPDVTRSGIPENETLIEQTKHTHMST
jgi:hypothetical protein